MKVDIEGADLLCLEALKAFPLRPDFVSLESDKTSLSRIEYEIHLLRELGYQEFQAVEQSSIPDIQQPPWPAREGQFAQHEFTPGASGLFGNELPDEWLDARHMIQRYRWIRLGYLLLGDDGVLNDLDFRGARRLRRHVRSVLENLTGGVVPGWYDTHARLSPSP